MTLPHPYALDIHISINWPSNRIQIKTEPYLFHCDPKIVDFVTIEEALEYIKQSLQEGVEPS